MEFLFGTWISLQKCLIFWEENVWEIFGSFPSKNLGQSSFELQNHPSNHLSHILQFQRIGACPPHIYCFQANSAIFATFQIRVFQTPQIVRPMRSNTSSNEFALRSILPMLPWQEQRDGSLNLDKLPLWPVGRWDDDLGQDEELGWCSLHRKDIMRIAFWPT